MLENGEVTTIKDLAERGGVKVSASRGFALRIVIFPTAYSYWNGVITVTTDPL